MNLAKREAALIEISKLKERDGVHLSENTQLKATLNQLEKVKLDMFIENKKIFFIKFKFINKNEGKSKS